MECYYVLRSDLAVLNIEYYDGHPDVPIYNALAACDIATATAFATHDDAVKAAKDCMQAPYFSKLKIRLAVVGWSNGGVDWHHCVPVEA